MIQHNEQEPQNGSVTEFSQAQNLQMNKTDYLTSSLKAILGTIPVVGSSLVELIGTIIPNQRDDRIAKFAEMLSQRLSKLSEDFVRSQLTNENYTDLLQESLIQVVRSVSQERREYIASLIANGISSDNIDYIESKHLLKLLGELNDIEVIWLRYHLVSTSGRDEEFMEKHQAVLQPITVDFNSSQEELDKRTLRQSYKEHLVQLGLLNRQYKVDEKTKQPKFDNHGQPQVSGYEITHLGRLLLKYIDLTPDGHNPCKNA